MNIAWAYSLHSSCANCNYFLSFIWALTRDFQQCGVLSSVDSEELYSLLLSLEAPNDDQSVA